MLHIDVIVDLFLRHFFIGVAEKFVQDVREATEIILQDPEAAGYRNYSFFSQ